MHKKLLVAAVLAVAATGAFAQAVPAVAPAVHPVVMVSPQPAGPAHEERTVTRDEFIAQAAKRFDEMDTNHDGKVTPEERHAFRRAKLAEWRAQHPNWHGHPHDGETPHDGPPPAPQH